MDRLIGIGRLKPAEGAVHPRLGIGLEKLDRNVFDPRPAYDLIARLGVRYVRLQSGWQRTERVKGVYDFAWLDEIVDALISRGMEPWLCLCYGNPLYSPEAARYFGAVGVPPIGTEEEKAGWRAYVTAVARRYAGRIRWYEVWNEPDGQWCWKHGVSAAEYARFAIDTGDAVRAADPAARVAVGAVSRIDLPYIAEMLEHGVADHADALSFHRYNPDERPVQREIAALRALLDRYRPGVGIIQGESGGQSDARGAGAMSGAAWTETRQAKYLLRHRVLDLHSEALFTSHFTSVDMIEALNGLTGQRASWLDYGYFGVLGAEFDPDGYASGTYTPKQSYGALQRLAAAFPGDERPAALPVTVRQLPSQRLLGLDDDGTDLMLAGFARPSGAEALAYWKASRLLSETFEGTISFSLARERRPIRLIDLMTGEVFALPEAMLERDGDAVTLIRGLPLTDAPLLLTFGDFTEQMEEKTHA